MWGDWVWFAGAALGTTTMLVGIVYMLAEVLMNDRMKSWAKMELVELFYTAIIISMAIVALPTIDGMVQGALMVSNQGGTTGAGMSGCTGSPTSAWIKTTDYGVASGKHYECLDICGPAIAASDISVYHGIESCHIRLGIWYMRELFDEAKNFAYDTYLSYITTAMIAAFSINIEFVFEAAGFFTVTPWAGFFTMGNTIKAMVFDWAIKLMLLTKFQEVIIHFIATALFPALFVAGAMLRTFTFTRRLGGLLLAMAIALYFIFPAFYAFAGLIVLNLKNDPVVFDAWIHSDANPGKGKPLDSPYNYPDPPIANMMYLNNSVIMMPGGSYSASEAQSALRDLEGMQTDDYYTVMEDAKNTGYMPDFDMSSNAYAGATEEEKASALETAWGASQTWFGEVSKASKLDKFIDVAWAPNGPVDSLARLTFWSTFFALISLLATIAAIRSLSITFGGDIEIAGLTRLI